MSNKFCNKKNKKGRTSNFMIWILIIGMIAYLMNFGGFKDTIDTSLGSTTNPSVSFYAVDGASQHAITDNSSHTNVESWNEPNNAEQEETKQLAYEYVNTEPSFIEKSGLAITTFMKNYWLFIIIFIAGGLIIGYPICKHIKETRNLNQHMKGGK